MAGPPLTPTRLQQVRALFEEALERTEAERLDYVVRACGDDTTLRAEVESLLAALERGGATWNRPLGVAALTEAMTGEETGVVGHRIGAYEVTRMVGCGGMGAVYEGTRADDQYRHVTRPRGDSRTSYPL